MGKKSAHTGMSPKDRSINLMDKFIRRNENRNRDLPFVSGIRKDSNIPLNMWPLKDQIEYWDSEPIKIDLQTSIQYIHFGSMLFNQYQKYILKHLQIGPSS
jgi:hypothetical protein